MLVDVTIANLMVLWYKLMVYGNKTLEMTIKEIWSGTPPLNGLNVIQ